MRVPFGTLKFAIVRSVKDFLPDAMVISHCRPGTRAANMKSVDQTRTEES
jgi:protein tyrosine phosphatase (PTP) superfamily phosphohydrolase (DUF442 family)